MTVGIKHQGIIGIISQTSDFHWGLNTITSFESVEATKLDSVDVVSKNKIRLNFSKPMTNNDDLNDVSNYSVIPISVGVAPVYFTSVTPQNTTYPEYVDITISEMTNTGGYRCVVSTDLVDKDSNPIHELFDTVDFVGVGDSPVVKSVVATSLTTCSVTFSESMRDNSDIRNPAKYNFDGGLVVKRVLGISKDVVTLKTSTQIPGQIYNLTVIP